MSRKSDLLERMKQMGIEPKRSLGQNFLVADQTIEKILAAARLHAGASLIEVGPGLGALTEGLITIESAFQVIELDRKFAEYWRSRGLKVTEADALALDWKTLTLPEATTLVSNLPYQISSSLVVERSVEPAGIAKMILMFQKEVGQRLTAKKSTKEYGLLSVIAQTYWEMRVLCDVGPGDFFPPPNVSSRVLTFVRREPSVQMNAADYLKFCKGAFSQRRKLMAKNLAETYFNGAADSKQRIEQALVEIGSQIQARAEELDPTQFVRLYSLLK